MIRRILPLALTLVLVACATKAPEALPSASTTVPVPASTASVPIPSQPAERPSAPESVTDPSIPLAQRQAAFVDYTARTYGIDPAYVRQTLDQAQFQQRIVDIMSRPAEAVRPWKDYRPIFMNDRAFWYDARTRS